MKGMESSDKKVRKLLFLNNRKNLHLNSGFKALISSF